EIDPATRRPVIDAMLMMLPPRPFAFMWRAVACATRQAPFRLTSTTLAQSVSVTSRNGLVTATPALFTRIVTGPSSPAASSMAARTLSGSVTSIAWILARPPAARISASTFCPTFVRRPTRATLAPAVANVSAKCRPRPPNAPVTNAHFPVKLCSNISDRVSTLAGIELRPPAHNDGSVGGVRVTGVDQPGARGERLGVITFGTRWVHGLKGGCRHRSEQLHQVGAAFGATQQLARLLRPSALDGETFQRLEVVGDVGTDGVGTMVGA